MRRDDLFALAEMAIVGVLATADNHGLIPLSATPFQLVFAWISLRIRGLRWRDVGLVWPHPWKRTLLLGVGAGISMEVFANLVSQPLITHFTGTAPDLSDFRALVGNLKLTLMVLVPMWLLAAFGEEMVSRGYVMNRIAGLGRRTPTSWIISLLVVSVFFGWSHSDQGLTGQLQEGLAGLLLGLLYLACGRRLAVPIIAHGTANTLAFLLIFLGKYPGV